MSAPNSVALQNHDDVTWHGSSARRNKWYFPLPGLLTLTLGLWIWMVFYPGMMSVDSIYQYKQAITGRYDDLFPPIMSAFLTIILKTGGNLATLMLIQCLAGCFGFRSFVMSILSSFDIEKMTADYVSFLLLLLFVSPVSPFAFYLMTFWKDSWYVILNLWICAVFMKLHADQDIRDGTLLFLCLCSASLIAFASLTRYNGIAVFPFWALILLVVLREHKKRVAFFTAMVLFSIMLRQCINYVQYSVLNVKKMYLGQTVMAMDMVGMLWLRPDLRYDLPYTSQHLSPDYRERYGFAEYYLFFNTDHPIVTFVHLEAKNDALVNEYFHAMIKHPFVWMEVKFRAFYELIRPDTFHKPYYFTGMEKNEFGLKMSDQFKDQRNRYKQLANLGIKYTPLRWISGVTIVWIVIGLIEFASCIYLYLKYKTKNAHFWASLLTLPLSYMGSYLLANTDIDYRLTYPTVLLLQVITASLVTSVLIRFARAGGGA